MKYSVITEPSAETEITAAFLWIAETSPLSAVRWEQGLERAIHSLANFPKRCRLAPESRAFGYEIRQLLYGNYRILFTIRGRTIHILHVRHAAMRPMTPENGSSDEPQE